jgi:hypothetical protein
MPKNSKKVSKFILKLAEILQVSVFHNFRTNSINKVSNGQKMEQGYKLKIENNFKLTFYRSILNSKKSQVLSVNFIFMDSIGLDAKIE